MTFAWITATGLAAGVLGGLLGAGGALLLADPQTRVGGGIASAFALVALTVSVLALIGSGL